MHYIHSSDNNRIKEICSLSRRKFREKRGVFLVEGVRMVEEALLNASVRTVVVADDLPNREHWLDRLGSDREVLAVPAGLFKDLAQTENPQGILAVVDMPAYDLADLHPGQGNVLIMDALQDPGNAGTLVRTAAAVNCAGVIAVKGTVDLYNPKVLRSTMGAIFRLPLIQGITVSRLLDWLPGQQRQLVVADAAAKQAYYHAPLNKPFALVIGNENQGANPDLADRASLLVHIPMPGKVESLNAAVAGSLILYEGMRQQRQMA